MDDWLQEEIAVGKARNRAAARIRLRRAWRREAAEMRMRLRKTGTVAARIVLTCFDPEFISLPKTVAPENVSSSKGPGDALLGRGHEQLRSVDTQTFLNPDLAPKFGPPDRLPLY